MRDTKKQPSYYEAAYADVSDEIVEYLEDIGSGENTGTQLERLKESLFRLYNKKLFLAYSSGKGATDMACVLEECVSTYDQQLFPVEYGYEYVLSLVSVWYVLELPVGSLSRMLEEVKRLNYNDRLVGSILGGMIDGFGSSTDFVVEEPYAALKKILQDGEIASVNDLQDYLVNSWYSGSRGTEWYDAHLSKGYAYKGYWSFESAALVKLLGLDDQALQGLTYYPYDLLRMNEDVGLMYMNKLKGIGVVGTKPPNSGLGEEGLNKLKEAVGLDDPWPVAVMEFLQLAGDHNNIQLDFVGSLISLQSLARESLNYAGKQLERPFLAFDQLDGAAQFTMVYLDEGHDPMVYHCLPLYPDKELLEQIPGHTFSSYIDALVEAAEKGITL